MPRLVAIIGRSFAQLFVGAVVGLIFSGFLPGRPPPGVLEDPWYLRRALFCGAVMAVITVSAGHLVIKSPLKEIALGFVFGALLGVACASGYAKIKEASDTTLPAMDGKRRANLQWTYIEIAMPVCLPAGVVFGGIGGYFLARFGLSGQFIRRISHEHRDHAHH